MTRQTPPLWLLVVGVSFFAYWTLLVYCEIWRPEPVGLVAEFDSGRMLLVAVDPGSPAERIGLEPDDHIVALDGQLVHNRLDWMALEANFRTGLPLTLTIDRRGNRFTTSMSHRPISWGYLATPDQFALRAVRFVQLVALGLAAFIIFKRPRDSVARIGAWLLASVAVLSLLLPPGLGAVWRGLPAPLGVLLWIPFVSTLAVAPIGFTFFAVFPRVAFRSPLAWSAIWAPVSAWLAWHAYYGYHLVYTPTHTTGLSDWSAFAVTASAAYVAGGLALLIWNYRRLDDLNQRRRVRVLAVGALVGGVSGGFVVLSYWLGSRADLTGSFLASPMVMIGTLLFLTYPLSFAYAILRHRLFDVSLIIRGGVRYALARRVLLSVVPALGVLLAIDFFLHRNSPLIALFRSHGWVYVVLAVIAVVAQLKRRQWLDSLDRRFFRERYNAQRLLMGMADDIRLGSVEEVAPRVVADIETALHPRFAALLVRHLGEPAYEVLASAPSGQAPAPLAYNTTLVALLRVLGKPLEVSLSESGWLGRQLPPVEAEFLGRTGIDLLVPIAVDPARPEALL